MAERLKVKRKVIYRLHRDNEKDHDFGRPAFIINARITKSLVWAGTTKYDKLNTEIPLTIPINDIPVYFYGNAIGLVETSDLKTAWIDNKTKKACVLTDEQQEAALKKISKMAQWKSPYHSLEQLTQSNQAMKDKLKKAQEINSKLFKENEKLKKENETLNLKILTLDNEKQLLKTKEDLEFEQE